MNQVLVIIYKAGSVQVNSDPTHPAFVQLFPRWPCLQGRYLPWLANRLPYDIALAGSVRDCDSVPASDTCNRSHLFFLGNFWKIAFLLSAGGTESANGLLAVYAILLHPKTHFILLSLSGPDSKRSLLEHAAFLTDFLGLTKYLPGRITVDQWPQLEILPTGLCILHAPEWLHSNALKKEGCYEKRLYFLPVQWDGFSSCWKPETERDPV